MRRGLHASVVVLVISAMALVVSGAAASGSTSTAPRWVKHVRNYPGGFSGTVRMSIRKAVIQATSAGRTIGCDRAGAAARLAEATTKARIHAPTAARPIAPDRAGAAAGANLQINDDTQPNLPQN